jgi:hypothetical protein
MLTYQANNCLLFVMFIQRVFFSPVQKLPYARSAGKILIIELPYNSEFVLCLGIVPHYKALNHKIAIKIIYRAALTLSFKSIWGSSAGT